MSFEDVGVETLEFWALSCMTYETEYGRRKTSWSIEMTLCESYKKTLLGNKSSFVSRILKLFIP